MLRREKCLKRKKYHNQKPTGAHDPRKIGAVFPLGGNLANSKFFWDYTLKIHPIATNLLSALLISSHFNPPSILYLGTSHAVIQAGP